tara:strand:- start:11372 stop:11557 length:186 start_codon:yes stop_codon:yes gene_type:complete
MAETSRNQKLLEEFTAHCQMYPNERFWQALTNWSGQNRIMADGRDDFDPEDTYYWETKDGK